ncbi:MAG: glycosyltransferase, partial [Nitrospinaceae bacterium]|nr:glycosyltransferase [Nitrospinaceae bacterium]NIU99321.1 glycosyltransferase [Nitrospinaceae bacterium]
MAILTVLQFLFIGFVLGYLFWNLVQLDRIPPVRGQLPRHPRVSICVPARNEERDIRACLTSLLEQDYPQFEVIAVDDHSDDATPEIIQSLAQHHPHLVFLPSEPLPPDWLGKPHALHQACRRATGEILLFTDADPVFQPWAVNSAVHTMLSRKLDLLTLMPRTEFGSFWERAVQPVIFGFIFALTRVGKIVQADSPKAMGFGAFLMFKREMLEKIGGYERVKGEVLEDVFLARHVKASGGRLLAA